MAPSGSHRRTGALDGQDAVGQGDLEVFEPEAGEFVADGQRAVRLEHVDPQWPRLGGEPAVAEAEAVYRRAWKPLEEGFHIMG